MPLGLVTVPRLDLADCVSPADPRPVLASICALIQPAVLESAVLKTAHFAARSKV